MFHLPHGCCSCFVVLWVWRVLCGDTLPVWHNWPRRRDCISAADAQWRRLFLQLVLECPQLLLLTFVTIIHLRQSFPNVSSAPRIALQTIRCFLNIDNPALSTLMSTNLENPLCLRKEVQNSVIRASDLTFLMPIEKNIHFVFLFRACFAHSRNCHWWGKCKAHVAVFCFLSSALIWSGVH